MQYQPYPRRGAIIVFVVVSMVVLLGCAALTIDVGYIYNARADLQNTADASALAAAWALPNQSGARDAAVEYAERNAAHYGSVLNDSDLSFGHWNAAAGTFTAGEPPFNAAHVVVRCSNGNGNPLQLFFAPILGISMTEVSASATALGQAAGEWFLLDDDVMDTDTPVIEQLADDLDIEPDELLSDDDGDGFIDIPPGRILELPTGQVGDEGMFVVGPSFEFTENSTPSLQDFLLYDVNGDHRGITSSSLDPLVGVEPASDSAQWSLYVDPHRVLVSPLYTGDISDTAPWVNAQGERRGLIAYKIIAIGADPDGGGSLFPNLVFEIVNPSTLDLSLIVPGAGRTTLQLVE
jgi:hypothetical protein